MQPFVTVALIIAVVLHGMAAVARPEVAFVLSGIRAMLFGVFVWCNAPSRSLSAVQRLLLKCIPRDVRTVLRTLHLEPDIVRYACCPRCCALYSPSRDTTQCDDPYPHYCSHPTPDGALCGAKLVFEETQAPRQKNGPKRTVFKPFRVFPYRTLRSWLKVFLSRPEVEAALVASSQRSSSSTWHNIMDSPAIRQFRGPDNTTLFSVQQHGSLNLVFSLFVDWFNPYGNKKAGKSHSIGAIYLACLNLPIDMRYAPEYIYLAGMIPGPREPALDKLNHFLRPLIDEFLVLWTRGMYFGRTALRWMGRFVRAALIPLVCDLPALRKTAGFAGHSSKHLCSFCPLPKDDIGNLNRSTWPVRRTRAEHIRIATEWRDADKARRDELFEAHGLQWSELLRLPYWDPTRFAVLDSMHNLFLGELRHHCMNVWGIDIRDKAPGLKKLLPHTPEEQTRFLQSALEALKKRSATALGKLRKGYIVSIAKLNDVGPIGVSLTKSAYVNALLEWVCS